MTAIGTLFMGPHVSVVILPLSSFLSLSYKNKTGLEEMFLLLFLVVKKLPVR